MMYSLIQWLTTPILGLITMGLLLLDLLAIRVTQTTMKDDVWRRRSYRILFVVFLAIWVLMGCWAVMTIIFNHPSEVFL